MTVWTSSKTSPKLFIVLALNGFLLTLLFVYILSDRLNLTVLNPFLAMNYSREVKTSRKKHVFRGELLWQLMSCFFFFERIKLFFDQIGGELWFILENVEFIDWTKLLLNPTCKNCLQLHADFILTNLHSPSYCSCPTLLLPAHRHCFLVASFVPVYRFEKVCKCIVFELWKRQVDVFRKIIFQRAMRGQK